MLILCSRVSQVASLGLRLFSDPGGIPLPFPTLRDSVRAMQNHECSEHSWMGVSCITVILPWAIITI